MQKIEIWGEKLEELINDIRRDNSTDSVHIHEFVRSLIKDVQKRQMLWLMTSLKNDYKNCSIDYFLKDQASILRIDIK